MMIEGVLFKELVTHTDERGFFREIIRCTDDFFVEGFGQWSHSLMYTGVVKAWHIHKTQIDWWYVIGGVIKVVLYDTRKNSPTHREIEAFLMGERQPATIVKIPPGVAHGCKCIQGLAHLLYITSKVYDPNEEGRIPHDETTIGYDWLKGPNIK